MPCYNLFQIVLFSAVLGIPFVCLLTVLTLLLLDSFFMYFVVLGCELIFSRASAVGILLGLKWGPIPGIQFNDCFCEKSWKWPRTNLSYLSACGVPGPH